jgi:hypothetical protein
VGFQFFCLLYVILSFCCISLSVVSCSLRFKYTLSASWDTSLRTVCPLVYLYTCLSVCMYTCLSVCIHLYLSVCLISLSVYLSIYSSSVSLIQEVHNVYCIYIYLVFLHIREGHVETTQLLLSKGAEINKPSGSNDDTPLTLACWKGHY